MQTLKIIRYYLSYGFYEGEWVMLSEVLDVIANVSRPDTLHHLLMRLFAEWLFNQVEESPTESRARRGGRRRRTGYH